MSELGDRIRLLVIGGRAKRRMTQAEFAKLLDVSEDTISKWENGKMPDASNLPRLAEVLGMSIDQLLTGEETFFRRVVQEVVREALRQLREGEGGPPAGTSEQANASGAGPRMVLWRRWSALLDHGTAEAQPGEG